MKLLERILPVPVPVPVPVPNPDRAVHRARGQQARFTVREFDRGDCVRVTRQLEDFSLVFHKRVLPDTPDERAVVPAARGHHVLRMGTGIECDRVDGRPVPPKGVYAVVLVGGRGHRVVDVDVDVDVVREEGMVPVLVIVLVLVVVREGLDIWRSVRNNVSDDVTT